MEEVEGMAEVVRSVLPYSNGVNSSNDSDKQVDNIHSRRKFGISLLAFQESLWDAQAGHTKFGSDTQFA